MSDLNRAGMVAAALIWFVVLNADQIAAQVPSAAQLQNSELETFPVPPLKPGANSFAESQAKALLESKGYSQISTLMNNSDGIWRGTAVKDDKKVDISVDFQGHVAAR